MLLFFSGIGDTKSPAVRYHIIQAGNFRVSANRSNLRMTVRRRSSLHIVLSSRTKAVILSMPNQQDR